MIKNISSAVIFDAGKRNPIRKRVPGPGVIPVFEKITNMQHEKWVDNNGNVKRVPLVTGASVRNDVKKAERVRLVQRNGGGIRYGECPLRTDAADQSEFPDELQGLCERGTFGESKACPHVEHIIVKRREYAQVLNDERNSERQSQKSIANEEAKKLNEDLKRAVVALAADKVEDKPKAKRGQRKAKDAE